MVATVIGFLGKDPANRADLLLHSVGYEPLQVSIVERGALESASNSDITCRVKAKTQGGVATSIKWVIDEGTQVQAGDKVMELDDSSQKDALTNQKIALDKSESEFTAAKENYAIVMSQNDSDIETAYLKLDLAQIALDQYRLGDYMQSRRDIEGRKLLAKSDLEMWEERAAWSERMSRPGRRYVTVSQSQADSARRVSAEIAHQKVIEELRVLDDFTAKARIKQLEGDVEEAWRAITRVERQARSKEVTAMADRKAKESVYEQQLDLYNDARDEVRKCLLTAPQAGMVVYYVPETSRSGLGSQSALIAQGESVREGQKMLRIPDLSQMVVNTKVHEAMVSKVRGERFKSTGFSDCVQATILLSHLNPFLNLTTLVGFSEVRNAFSEQNHNLELVLISQGQMARVRIDAFPDRILRGHVKTVATMASQTDWMSSDVKVYQTMVAIDEPLEGLKPGMSAEVTVQTDTNLERVLTIPLQAIVGGVNLGSQRKCFVMTDRGPEERDIILGASNEKMAEVKSGLTEGDKVVQNPRTLLNERKKNGGPELKEIAPADGGKKGNGEKGGKKKGGPGGPGQGPPGM